MCVCLIFRASSGANQDISIDDKRISSPLCKQNNRVCFRLQIYLRCKSAQVWRSKRDAAKQSALVVAVVAVVVIVARTTCESKGETGTDTQRATRLNSRSKLLRQTLFAATELLCVAHRLIYQARVAKTLRFFAYGWIADVLFVVQHNARRCSPFVIG